MDMKLASSWLRGTTGRIVISIGGNDVCFASGKYIFFQRDVGADASAEDCGESHSAVRSANGRHVDKLAFTPFGSILAYSEIGVDPKVHVHRLDGTKTVTTSTGGVGNAATMSEPLAVLAGGAKLELRSLEFSSNGRRLVMLSGVPDFQLSVWDWQAQTCLCRVMCSSHPLEAAFSPTSWQKICTRGQHSITVWKVETCGDTCQLTKCSVDLPRVRESKYPSLDSDSRLDPLPMAYPKAVEPVLNRLGEFPPNSLRRPVVEITAMSWYQHTVYASTACGSLLKIKTDGSVRFDDDGSTFGMFARDQVPTAITAARERLLTACADGVLRTVVVPASGKEVLQLAHEEVGKLPGRVVSMSWMDNLRLLVSCAQGDLLVHDLQDNQLKVCLARSCSPIVSVQVLWPGIEHYVTCRSNGALEVGNIKSGDAVAEVSLTEDLNGSAVTALAMCPSVQYIAIGDSTGTVTFMDAEALQKGQKRILHSTRMHSGPVARLWFDDFGKLLLTSSMDGRLYVCSPLPTEGFAVRACIELQSQLLDICCRPVAADSHPSSLDVFLLMASKSSEDDKEASSKAKCKVAGGKELMLLSLPLDADGLQAMQSHLDKMWHLDVANFGGQVFNLPEACTSVCTLSCDSAVDIAASSAERCALLALKHCETEPNPESDATLTSLEMTVVNALDGPQLRGGHVFRNLAGDLLVSCGLDGQVMCGAVDDWDHRKSLMLHSHRTQGCHAACMSWDSKDIVSTGQDGVIASSLLSPLSPGSKKKMAEAVAHYRQVKQRLVDTHQEQAEKMTSFESLGADSIRVAQTGKTWMERRLDEVNQETERQFNGERNTLLADVAKLRDKLMALIAENELKPDLEQLDRAEFNLDVEESNRLMVQGNEKAQEVREELELKNIANEYLSELIREECWDSMEAPGKSLKGFHIDLEVSNFAIPKEDPSLRAELEFLLQQREMEIVEMKERVALEETVRPESSPGDEDGEEGANEEAAKAELLRKADADSLHTSLEGSIAHSLQGRHPLAYAQMELSSRTRIYFQLHIIKESIRKMKQAFNKEFDALLLQKESEVARTQERNTRMTKIIQDLGLKEVLFHPVMSTDEQPERLLRVEDSEIKAEKWISPEEQLRLDELARQEEARRLAELGDRPRERALDQMMQGRLEIDPEEELFKDIVPPDFMDTRIKELWTVEEQKMVKDYHAAVEHLEEERMKHKKALEAEFKKLQSSVAEALAAFDEKAVKLHEKKIQHQTAICQEEMKVSRLTTWLLTEDEFCAEEERLLECIEVLRASKTEITKTLTKVQTDLGDAKEESEKLGIEDKVLERNFKRDFVDREGIYDLLYKSFRRRPKQVKKGAAEVKDPAAEMAELDSMASCPEGVDAATWNLVVAARRRKMESEKTIRQTNHQIAEMTAFVEVRAKEEAQAASELSTLGSDLACLRKERERFYMNLPIQLLLKQGQVEIEPGAFVTDYRGSELIDRKIVDLYNTDIKTLGEGKVATLLKGIEGKKGIYVLEWEHKKMRMQLEDFDRQVHVVNGLRVTKTLQQHFTADNPIGQHNLSIERLESALSRTAELHEHRMRRLERVRQGIVQKSQDRLRENDEMQADIMIRYGAVMESMKLDEAFAPEDSRKVKDAALRMGDLVRRSQTVKRVKFQAEQIAGMRAELNRWRNKMFPALPPLKKNG